VSTGKVGQELYSGTLHPDPKGALPPFDRSFPPATRHFDIFLSGHGKHGDGGFYRGEYYDEKQMDLIREAEKLRASIESRREILIARGDDPEAMLAKIDGEMDVMFAQWADLRATQDAQLDAEVKTSRNLLLQGVLIGASVPPNF